MIHSIHESTLLRTRLEQLERDLSLLPPAYPVDGLSRKVIATLFRAAGMDTPDLCSVESYRLAIRGRLLLPDLTDDDGEGFR